MRRGKRVKATLAWVAFNGNGEVAWQFPICPDKEPIPIYRLDGWSDTFGTYDYERVRIQPIRAGIRHGRGKGKK